MKKIALAAVAVIVLATGGVLFLYSNVDSILKAAIEKYGSEATQAQVRADTLTLSLVSGAGAISGVVVGNPRGFNTPSAFELGTISLQVDTATVTQNPVVIREVIIVAPKVTYERGAGTGNLETIRDNVRSYAGAQAPSASGGGTSSSAGAPAASKADAVRKLIIENLYVRDGQVVVAATALQGRTLNTRLPAIHLRDIGKDKGGATPAEVAQHVIGAIAEEAARTGLADLNRSLRELGGTVQEHIQRAAPGAGDRLRSILPGGRTN